MSHHWSFRNACCLLLTTSDHFYLLSIGLMHTAAARLGQAVQLAFSLDLHKDSKTQGLDAVEVQLRRRVFWQLYASDKYVTTQARSLTCRRTRAIFGNPMLINDFQGVCSYPEATDDEFITSQGMFPQPASKTSLLAGFVAVSKLFRILSECFFHDRCIRSQLQTISLDWTSDADDRVHDVLRDLPAAIQDPNTVPLEENRQGFATQRANILITVAIVKFALVSTHPTCSCSHCSMISAQHCTSRRNSSASSANPSPARSTTS